MTAARSVTALGALLALAACSPPDNEPKPVARPRPVAVATLEAGRSADELELPGVVSAWVREDIAAEVTGRVVWIAEEGTQVRGGIADPAGNSGERAATPIADVLARIDPDTYEASMRAARARLDRTRVRLQDVVPARIAKAEAVLRKRQFERERLERVRESGSENAVSELRLSDVTADVDAAAADVAEARAARLEAEAELAEAEAAVVQAELDLERTTIRAPFPGEVAVTRQEIGGFASAGSTLLHLVRMNPVRIDVTVSADMARRIEVDDIGVIELGDGHTQTGRVFQKATAADPETRTFRISFITRNDARLGSDSAGSAISADGEAVVTRWIGGAIEVLKGPLESMQAADLPPSVAAGLYVPDERALRRGPDGRAHVWTITPLDDTGVGPRSYRARRVDVVPGDAVVAVQGVVRLRVLTDGGGLEAGDLIALDPADDLTDGCVVRALRPRWRLRPGQTVRVRWSPPSGSDSAGEAANPTFTVPATAVRLDGDDRGTIFLAVDGQARQVPVALGPSRRGARQIRAVDATPPLAGAQLIVRGAHYLRDGETVDVVQHDSLRHSADDPSRREE